MLESEAPARQPKQLPSLASDYTKLLEGLIPKFSQTPLTHKYFQAIAAFYFIDVIYFEFDAVDALTIIDAEYTYIYISKAFSISDQLIAGWRELIKFLLNAPATDYDAHGVSRVPPDLDYLYNLMATVAVNP